jgi:nicotinate-nucleotide adenylyltransferase
MGGAFNAIHLGHLMLAQRAKDQFQLERVIIVTSGTPPHKRAGLLDKELRFEMVAAAVADNPGLEASRLEIDRPGVSWTIDTLKELQALHGSDVRLNFIMGEDVVQSLKRYDRCADFIAVCRLLVAPRLSATSELVDSWRKTLPGAELEAIDCPANALSSTIVRAWVKAGASVRYLVPPAVCKIIEEKGHYKETAAPAADANPTASVDTVEAATPAGSSASPSTGSAPATEAPAPVEKVTQPATSIPPAPVAAPDGPTGNK